MTASLLCCTDLQILRLPDDTWQIRTSTNSYRVRGENMDLLRELLPKLDGTRSLEEVFPPESLNFVRLLIPQLQSMGILFSISNQSARYLKTPADAQLYTYLARRSPNPERLFVQMKEHAVKVLGHPHLSAPLIAALTSQGFQVSEVTDLSRWWKEASASPTRAQLLIAPVPRGSHELLHALNTQSVTYRVPWVPVIYHPASVQIGPWVYPGETACLACLSPAHPSNAEEQDPAFPQLDIPSSIDLPPAALTWAAAVLAFQLMQAVCALGNRSPWGRLVHLDLNRLTQSSKQVWKQPGCPVCAPTRPQPQRWMEA